MSQGLPAAGSVLQRSVAAPGNQPQPQPQSPEDDDRKVRRREKNRVAAQRSRKKQTQKADKLHEEGNTEYECLEQENTMLRREIGKLTEELKHLTEALKEHEKMCPLLLCPLNFVPVPPRPDPVAGCLPR
uniref:Basic leucine zipper ATF-like transcription factor 3 n=1 Tax=Cercocebus atys TaxID=9531 RepID=A0A2K5MRG9_CERAT